MARAMVYMEESQHNFIEKIGYGLYAFIYCILEKTDYILDLTPNWLNSSQVPGKIH